MNRLFENWHNYINEVANDINQIAKVVIVHEGRALILLRSGYTDKHKGKWDLPGGHLTEGENLLEGLLREVLEETSLRLQEPIEELYSMGNTTYFKAALPPGNISLSEEHTEYQLVSREELPENLSSKYRIAIMAAL